MIGRAGMDSSRSGLLSTILMTLPLIVVPAVALLRPPGQAGVSTVDLAASENESELDDSFFDDFDDDPAGAFKKEHSGHSATSKDHRHHEDDGDTLGTATESDIFDDLKTSAPEVREDSSEHASPLRRTQIDPFMDTRASQVRVPKSNGTPEADPASKFPEDAKHGAGEIVGRLNALGALKAVWFDAGEKTPVGLAVFFRGSKENTRIRFESVGQSRDACAQDVLTQVERWQQQNPE
jgi:hypothetical protein